MNESSSPYYVFVSAGLTVCSSCASGRFSNHNPGGTACEDTGAPTSSPTSPPSVAPSSTPTAAPTPCQPGKFQKPGESSCSSCLAGSYSAVAGQTSCSLCSRGTANPHSGQASAGACVLCENGKIAPSTGIHPETSTK